MVPISALAYELIRYAAPAASGLLGDVFARPGPGPAAPDHGRADAAQLEVAVVALREALDPEEAQRVRAVPYAAD